MYNRFVDGKCTRKIKNKEVLTISIIAGIDEDIEATVYSAYQEFEKVAGPRFSAFTKVWKESSFGCIFNGRESYRDLYEFTEEIFDRVKQSARPVYQNRERNHLLRYAGLYMMYALFFKQPCRPRVKLRLTMEEMKELQALVEQARAENHWDVVYAWCKLFDDHAFHFTALPTQMGLEMAIQLEQRKRMENLNSRGTQNEYFKSKEFYGMMKGMRKIHSKYTRMKESLSNARDEIDQNLYYIDANLPETIKEIIDPKEEPPEEKLYTDRQGIGSKRRDLKNKYFSAGGVSDGMSGISD